MQKCPLYLKYVLCTCKYYITDSICHLQFPKVVLAHILGKVCTFCTVLLNVYSKACLPVFIESVFIWLTQTKKISRHLFLRHDVEQLYFAGVIISAVGSSFCHKPCVWQINGRKNYDAQDRAGIAAWRGKNTIAAANKDGVRSFSKPARFLTRSQHDHVGQPVHIWQVGLLTLPRLTFTKFCHKILGRYKGPWNRLCRMYCVESGITQ